jgi:alginate O-acetyltransferase complex protein AlgI
MLFNSLEFAGFFPVVGAIYFALPHARRTSFLLLASAVFYMAFVPAYILVLGATIGIDYAAALRIERARGRARTLWLAASIAATCLILFAFKYYAFFTSTFVGLATLVGWHPSPPTLDLILPVGLSFHTFQSLSYVIEVHRGRQTAERDWRVFATYVLFFPQLVAGPIERPQNLLEQFRARHEFDPILLTSGLKRMAWGFFKKLVIADRLALHVNDVYADPSAHSGPQLAVATAAFAYQIYCDFSGYSDIAVGAARILGFRLMENFDAPYAATSTGEFWRRWHISLSTWFRDYVYVPLGGGRSGPWRRTRNLLVTFALSGLWHGAAWNFVIWGLLNGLYVSFGHASREWRDRFWTLAGLASGGAPRRALMWMTTFSLTCLAWVFFRASSLSDAIEVITRLGTGWSDPRVTTENCGPRQLVVGLAAVIFLETAQRVHRSTPLTVIIGRLPTLPRWSAYAGFIVLVGLAGVHGGSRFIYFQF